VLDTATHGTKDCLDLHIVNPTCLMRQFARMKPPSSSVSGLLQGGLAAARHVVQYAPYRLAPVDQGALCDNTDQLVLPQVQHV
jgi:hypothetical protein